YQHLEAYFGIPLMGGVLHTLNLRLHPDELAFIVNDAEDRVALVDHGLLPLWEKVAPQTRVRHTIIVDDPAGPGPAHRLRQGSGESAEASAAAEAGHDLRGEARKGGSR